MGRDEFREALFEATEALIKHKISFSGRALIMNYFNDSTAPTTLERAVEAMNHYSQFDFPPPDKRNRELKRLLNRLAYEAAKWDEE